MKSLFLQTFALFALFAVSLLFAIIISRWGITLFPPKVPALQCDGSFFPTVVWNDPYFQPKKSRKKNRVKCPTAISGVSLLHFAIKMEGTSIKGIKEAISKSRLKAVFGHFNLKHTHHA